MTNIEQIKSTLARMNQLLNSNGYSEWANSIKKLHDQIDGDPYYITRNILRLYGGMGSLNDIVLYKDGQPPIKENNEFDELRSKLYHLCHQITPNK